MREVAFDFLVDPRNRPQWQSSLARVADVDGEPRVGQTWVDVTRIGAQPRLETVELGRPHRWVERGSWHGIEATLALDLIETPTGCDVLASILISGPVAFPLRMLAPWAVRADLRRAASSLSP